MSKHWYEYRSKNRKVRGIIPAKSKEEVARLVGYPVADLVIERVRYDGERFVKCKGKKK